MSEDLIQFPELDELKEMLEASKEDINFETQQDPGLVPQSKLLLKVINILEQKLNQYQDLATIGENQKIELAAYISFLQTLEEDFFEGETEIEEDEEGGEEPLDERL